ncbi:hypothetical protein [Labrys sp. 22185]|uniref:hypothetical protein n=1 Tax=Labrys sp. 22185 TaxID=3453888 RepID=UPI003F86A081
MLFLLSTPLLASFGLDAAKATPISAGHGPALQQPSGFVRIGEKLDIPVRPRGWKPRPATPAATMNAVTSNLQARFEKAAGSPTLLLTRQAALTSGWGWAADHFEAIDTRHKGAISLDDVLAYVQRTSKVALPSPAASQTKVRVIP